MLALADAVFAGPAGRSVGAYHAFVGNQVRLGFGRVRRMLLHLAPPELVLERAPELWRHDHSDGELVVAVEGKHAHVEIVDHPHATTDVACLTAAEIFRCVLSLTRASQVTSTYRRTRPRCLEVQLGWS
jgi:hypothetical protein